jgi:serine protease Do
MRQRILSISLLILTFMLGGLAVYLFFSSPATNRITNKINKITIDDKGISTAVDKVYNAVVLVEVYKGKTVASSGTGFVYKKDKDYGYIITNEHVVNSSGNLVVTFANNKDVEATLLGGDVFADIAVLRVPVSEVLNIVSLGDSNKIKLGDTLFTVGSPVGSEYMGTVTRGILSGKNRMVSVSVSGGNTDDWIMEVLQTDAAINPGNSGGPLVNINGEVIGINSMKFVKQEIEGMGFAIPIEYAMMYIDKLEKGQKIERPYLGIQLIDVEDTYGLYSAGIMIDQNITSGVVVGGLETGSPAAKSGLKKGDIILKVNDDDIKNRAYLRYSLYKHKVGDTIKITYYRDKKVNTVNIKLTKVNQEL